MQRRKFSREFKIEAVKLVRDRGVSVAQAGRDLGVHENVLRKWVKEFGFDSVQCLQVKLFGRVQWDKAHGRGCVASAMASASRKSFLWPLRYGFTYCAGKSRT
ncbi:hypothetical protein ABIB85_008524 [Bradyrhizobium sp. JR1.5]